MRYLLMAAIGLTLPGVAQAQFNNKLNSNKLSTKKSKKTSLTTAKLVGRYYFSITHDTKVKKKPAVRLQGKTKKKITTYVVVRRLADGAKSGVITLKLDNARSLSVHPAAHFSSAAPQRASAKLAKECHAPGSQYEVLVYQGGKPKLGTLPTFKGSKYHRGKVKACIAKNGHPFKPKTAYQTSKKQKWSKSNASSLYSKCLKEKGAVTRSGRSRGRSRGMAEEERPDENPWPDPDEEASVSSQGEHCFN